MPVKTRGMLQKEKEQEQKQEQKQGVTCEEVCVNVEGEETEECAICRELLNEDVYNTKCKHQFHKTCLKRMNNDICPLCRKNMGINIEIGRSFDDTLRSLQLLNETVQRVREEHELRQAVINPRRRQIVNYFTENPQSRIVRLYDSLQELNELLVIARNMDNETGGTRNQYRIERMIADHEDRLLELIHIEELRERSMRLVETNRNNEMRNRINCVIM